MTTNDLCRLLTLALLLAGDVLFRKEVPKNRLYTSPALALLVVIISWGDPHSWPRFWICLSLAVVAQGLFFWNMITASRAIRADTRRMEQEILLSTLRMEVMREILKRIEERAHGQDLRK